MRFATLTSVLTVALSVLALAEVRAQDTDRGREHAGAAEGETDETLALFFGRDAVVSVTTTREEPLDQTPASVVVITEREIRERGYRDLMDVLHDLPGLDIASYLDGGNPTSVLVRGIAADNNKIVVLRDGVPINLPATFYKFGRNLPLFDVERIEVLYGPASVVYGADAVSAVIQLITRNPRDRPTVELEASGGSFDPLQGFDRYIGDAHASLTRRFGEELTATASVRTYQSNGPDLLESYPADFAAVQSLPPPYTGRYEPPIRAWNVDGRISSDHFAAGGSYVDHAWSSMLDKNPNPPFSGLVTSDAVERFTFAQAWARHEDRRGAFDFRTIATYGHFRIEPETAFLSLGSTSYGYAEQESVRLDHRTSWTPRNTTTLTGGLRLQRFSIVPANATFTEPMRSRNLAEAGLAHLTFSRFGVFALAEGRPFAKLKLTGGLSYEYEGNARESKLLPRAGAVLTLSGGAAHVKALYGEAFQAASPDAQYLEFSNPGVIAFVPNPELKGEHMRSAELRYDRRIGAKMGLEASVHYNRVTGLQQRVSVGPMTVGGVEFPAVFTTANLGLTRTWGGEGTLRVAPTEEVQLTVSYSFLEGRETLPLPNGDTETVDLSKIANHKLLAGITVRPLPGLVADARLRWVGDVRTRPTNSQFAGGLMPGYYDLNLNLRAENLFRRGLDAHLLVENLTDNRYYHFSFSAESGTRPPRTPQPPLRFLFGLTYRR